MTDRQEIARQVAQRLRGFAPDAGQTRVLVGFDGFVDSIIAVVGRRHDTERYDPMPTIADFGSRISAAAGKSANFELVTKQRKLGGNGPIMANAMCAAGLGVRYVGCLGEPEVDPVFADLVSRAESVTSLGRPGLTDALEFTDGKLMLGKHEAIKGVDAQRVREVLGVEGLREQVSGCAMVAAVNWTMLTGLDSIWQLLSDEVLPALDERIGFFVDLCDPAKREDSDLAAAFRLLGQVQRHADVTLGLNLAEAIHTMRVLGLGVPDDPEASIESMAADIRGALEFAAVVVHPRSAAAAVREHDTVTTARFRGPFTKTPRLSTGAGDNFNAGFCLGRLMGLDVEQCLCVGTATSGFYVRNANSPTADQLAAFCDDLPEPAVDA